MLTLQIPLFSEIKHYNGNKTRNSVGVYYKSEIVELSLISLNFLWLQQFFVCFLFFVK